MLCGQETEVHGGAAVTSDCLFSGEVARFKAKYP